jgi:hypothetical protein
MKAGKREISLSEKGEMMRKENRCERRDVEKGKTVHKENRCESTLKAAESWKVRRAFRNFESTFGFRDAYILW